MIIHNKCWKDDPSFVMPGKDRGFDLMLYYNNIKNIFDANGFTWPAGWSTSCSLGGNAPPNNFCPRLYGNP